MWFTETPWPPLAILGLIALGLLFAAFQTQQGKWLLAIVCCAVLALAVWFIEQAIITPGELVEANLLAMIDAFQKNDEPGTLKFISPSQKSLVALAQLGIKAVEFEPGYSVSDIQIKTIANNTAATSHFRFVGAVSVATQGNLSRMPFRFRGHWRIEAGQWRLTEIEDLDPINGKTLNRWNMLR
jgi:hypothetical protein